MLSPRTLDLVGIVLAAVADNQLAALPARLAPPHAEYARLKATLQRYRKITATNLSAQAREQTPAYVL